MSQGMLDLLSDRCLLHDDDSKMKNSASTNAPYRCSKHIQPDCKTKISIHWTRTHTHYCVPLMQASLSFVRYKQAPGHQMLSSDTTSPGPPVPSPVDAVKLVHLQGLALSGHSVFLLFSSFKCKLLIGHSSLQSRD